MSKNGKKGKPPPVEEGPRKTPVCSRPVTPRLKPINEKEQLFTDIRRRNIDGLVQLLERGPDLDSVDPDFGVPFIYAAQQGNIPAMRKLVEFGADVNFNYQGTALHAAMLRNDVEMIDVLIDEMNADVGQRTIKEKTCCSTRSARRISRSWRS